MTITERDIPVDIMKKDIPAVTAVEADAVHTVPSQDVTWAKPAALITEEHLMMEHSLTPLMTVANLWNLFAEWDR